MNVRLATAAATAAVGALLLVGAPTATAATPPATAPVEQAAPDLQAEFPVSVNDAEITFRGEELTLDLSGTASLTLGAPSPGKLEAKATGTLSVSAQHPDLGKITVESKATGTVSFNSVLTPFPAELDLSITGTATIENPGTAPQRGMSAAPLVLTTKNPAPLASPGLSEFPPKGEFSSLQNPIELVDSSGESVATVNKFPVTVGSL